MFAKQLRILPILFSLLPGITAQSGGKSTVELVMEEVERRFQARDAERRDAERLARLRFEKRAADFARHWNAFVTDYNRGALNVREARELSRAFHKMEQSAPWPRTKPPGK